MFEALTAADRALFHWINGAHAPWLDFLMVAVTKLGDSKTLLPVMAAWAALSVLLKSQRRVLLIAALALIASDFMAHQIKPLAGRLRPSHALEGVHLLVGMGGRFGFPSNHATNAFALAWVLGFFWPRRRAVFLIIAGFVAFSRVYVGVHYPLDVAAGAVLGTLLAQGVLLLYRQIAAGRPPAPENKGKPGSPTGPPS